MPSPARTATWKAVLAGMGIPLFMATEPTNNKRLNDLSAIARKAKAEASRSCSRSHGEDIREPSRGTRCPSDAARVALEERRAQGTPDAGCTREPCVQRKCTLRTQASTGQPRQPAFPARWFTAYTWSPRSTGLVSLRRLARSSRTGLIPASGDRDNTISLVRLV